MPLTVSVDEAFAAADDVIRCKHTNERATLIHSHRSSHHHLNMIHYIYSLINVFFIESMPSIYLHTPALYLSGSRFFYAMELPLLLCIHTLSLSRTHTNNRSHPWRCTFVVNAAANKLKEECLL